MEHTKEHKDRIAEAMKRKWQDPQYRGRQVEKEKALAEMWADPETRQRMTVTAENTAETVKAFVLSELDRRVEAPRRAQAEAEKATRRTVADVLREQRRANRLKAADLRRQIRELRQQREQQELAFNLKIDELRHQAKALEKQ